MPPIDVHNERLLPLRDVPDYLVSRGLGTRVSMRSVNRWVRDGCNGAKLESVLVDRMRLTSMEALQRWIDAQTLGAVPGRPATTADVQGQTREHATSVHLLTEHRVLPTELDGLIGALNHPRTTLAFAAGVLFRAGLRTAEDARKSGLAGLLALPGLGVKSKSVVRSLWRAVQLTPFTSID